MQMTVGEEVKTVTLRRVLYVPTLKMNMVSMSCVRKSGHEILVKVDGRVEIWNAWGELLCEGKEEEGLYKMSCQTVEHGVEKCSAHLVSALTSGQEGRKKDEMAIAELEETVAKLHEQQWELAQKLENAEGEIARGREKAAFAIKAKEIEMQNLREMSLQNSHAIKELKKQFDRQARETIENEKSEAKQLPEGKVLVTPAHPGNAQKLTETLKERGRPEVVETEIEEWRPEESQQNKVEKGVLEQGHGGNKQEGARVSPMDGEEDSEQTGEQRADRVEPVKNLN